MRLQKDEYAWTLERLRTIFKMFQFLWKEMRTPVRLPPGRTIKGWRRGFGRLPNLIYGLDRNDPSLFIPPYVQHVSGARINGYFDHLINNKLFLPHLLGPAGLPCAETLAFQRAGKWMTLSGARIPDLSRWLVDVLSRQKKVVIKPVRGYNGKGLIFLERRKNAYWVNGAPVERDRLSIPLSSKRDLVIDAFVEQDDYARSLNPRTSNSIRLLTLWDFDSGSPFVAAAAQRIGTSRSFPVDNWSEGMGGLCSEVDLESGVLSAGARVEGGNRVAWHACHPETGARIQGVSVRRWRRIKRRISEGARNLPFAPLIGWDILVTEKDFCVLEINGLPGLHVHQVHRPLLTEPKVRRFYKAYGLVS